MGKISLSKWIIIFTVVSASMLQLIDTSIVNVTLSDMMGNLGATLTQIGWVVTGYAAANVVMIVLSGWLSYKLGRKNYFTGCIILFTLASFFCGNAHTIAELILFRIIQGFGGGGLLSTAQSILIESFPREDIGMANAIFGMGVIIGPAIGPTLGGYITDHLSWNWVFFINIPIGILATVLSLLFIQNSKEKFKAGRIDWLAFALLTAAIFSMQTVLENGEREDWFSTNYITILVIVSVLATFFFIWRQLVVESPILDLKLLKHYRFSVGIFFAFMRGFGQYASLFIIPVFCQNILGYTAEQTGWLLMPGSIAAAIAMPIVGRLMKVKKLSPIWLAAAGFVFYIIFLRMVSDMNLSTGADDFFWPIVIRGIGGGFLFSPMVSLTVYDLKNVEMPQGTAFLNMARQLGGSFGIAIMTTFITIRTVYHSNILHQDVSMYNGPSVHRLHMLTNLFKSKGFGQHSSIIHALTLMQQQVEQQARLLSYSDAFYIVCIFFVIMLPLLLLFVRRKKQAEREEYLVHG